MLPSRAARTVLLAITMVFQVAMFFVMSWGAPAAWNTALHVPIQDAHNPFNDNTSDRPQAIDPLAFLYYQYPPKAHRWHVTAIMDTVFSDIEQTGKTGQQQNGFAVKKPSDEDRPVAVVGNQCGEVHGDGRLRDASVLVSACRRSGKDHLCQQAAEFFGAVQRQFGAMAHGDRPA